MNVFASQSPGSCDDLLLVDSHASGVRQKPRDRQAQPARRRRRLRILPQPQPFLLGFSAARHLRARRDSQGRHGRLAQTRRARRRAGTAGAHASPRRRDADRRQGLRRRSLRSSSQRDVRHDPAPTAQGRARQRPHLAPIRQRIESIFCSCKGTLTLERHGARTLAGLRERILSACSPSPPPSPSTTNSADPAAHSPTTAPKTELPCVRGAFLWLGGRGVGLGVGVASLMMRGLGTPGPGFVLPACAL